MSTRVKVLLVAAGLLVVGLLIGLRPITVSGTDCGSAFRPNTHDPLVEDFSAAFDGYQSDVSGECADKLNDAKFPANALMIAGGIALLVTWGVHAKATLNRKEE